MKKIALLILLVALMVACSVKEPPVATELLVTSLGQYNITLYKNLTTASYIEFELISDFSLEDATVVIDIATPYTVSIVDKPKEEYPYYVFQNYQSYDWDKMYELHIKAHPEDKQAMAEFDEYRNKYFTEFERKYNNPPLKNSFYYTISIFFQMVEDGQNESFNTITLQDGERDYDIEVGLVTLDYSTAFDRAENILSSYSLGAWSKGLMPNPDGTMIINDAEYMVMEDLYITNIYLFNPNSSIVEVSISIEHNNLTVDKLYIPGTKLFLSKDSFIKPRIVVKDSDFINQHFYSTFVYAVIEYEVNNTIHYAYFESMFRTRTQMYELYAAQVDNIDFLPFYYQYLSRLSN